MAGMNPLGRFLHARDGGLDAPFDNSVFSYVQAQAAESGRKMEVKGTAVQMGVVGWFWFGALRLEKGSIVEAPGKHRRYRDVMGLYAHDSAQVLARVGANTMDVEYGEEQITYAMRLNEADSLGRDVWARLVRGDLNSASIGFIPVEGEWVEAEDNSLDAEGDGEPVEIFACTKAELVEVSIVGQGAFSGATSYPASSEWVAAFVEAELAAMDAEVLGGETVDHLVKNSLPSGVSDGRVMLRVSEGGLAWRDAANSDTIFTSKLAAGEIATAVVEGVTLEDDEQPTTAVADDTGASADRPEGGEGDVAGSVGEDNVGGAEPDGNGNPTEESEGGREAEAQGWTVKEMLGAMPSQVKRRLDL